MARTVACPILLLAVAFAAACATADAARQLKQNIPEPLQPDGIWQAARIVSGNTTTICGLRDFPPIGGEGEARMLCGGAAPTVSPYWVWKITRPGDDGTSISGGIIAPGEPVHLRIFNSMTTYCRTRSNGQLWCGVGSNRATNFTLEKIVDDGNDFFTWDTESVYLKQNGRYCRVQGRGNSAYVFCNANTPAQATQFQFPERSFYSVSLTSTLSELPCGATFIIMDYTTPAYVNCTTGAAIPSNFYTKFVATQRVPGTGFVSGNDYAFMTFDNLWHYQVAAWSAATEQVVSLNNDMVGNKFFFTVDKVDGEPGDVLFPGNTVTIRSVVQNKYCGIATNTSNMLCDSEDASAPGYRFTWSARDDRMVEDFKRSA